MHDSAVIILARGGSKGLRNKNLLPIAGRPCVEYTIDDAMEVTGGDGVTGGGWMTGGGGVTVCLSSDSPAILAVGAARGIVTHRRSEGAAGDRATVDEAAREAVTDLMERGLLREFSDAMVMILYGNVPIRPRGLVRQAAEFMRATGCDSVQSYASAGKYHPFWTVRVEEDGRVKPWQGDVLYHNIFRRQDLPAAQVPDGGVMAVRLGALFYRGLPAVGSGGRRGPHDFLGVDRRGIITQQGSVIDIDDEVDYEVANVLMRRRLEREQAEFRTGEERA